MGAMQRVARLKGDDATPPQLAEAAAQFRRGVAQQLEIVVGRRFDAAHAPAQINRARAV